MSRILYEFIEIFETIDEKTIKRYKLLKDLLNSKFAVHTADFIYDRDDLQSQIDYLNKNMIEAMFYSGDKEHLTFHSSIEEAIEAHDKEFDSF